MTGRLAPLLALAVTACTSAGNEGPIDGGPDTLWVSHPRDASVDVSDAAAPTCDADLSNDPQNCGKCAHDCIGGDCTAGACGATKFLQTWAYGVAVDGTSLFWDHLYSGAIERCSINNCLWTSKSLSFDAGAGSMSGLLAIDNGWIYDGTYRGIVRISGGTSELVLSDQNRVGGIAFAGGKMYFVDANGLSSCDPNNCAPTVTALYAGNGGLVGLATDGKKLFVTDYGGVYATDMLGQSPQELSTFAGHNRPWGVAVDGAMLYVSFYDPNTLVACPVVDCDKHQTVLFKGPAGQKLGYGVAYDDVSIFIAEGGSSSIWRVAKP